MRLVEQFRVIGPDGTQQTIACYEDDYRSMQIGPRKRVDGVRRYCLSGGQDVQRVDDETFLTDSGVILYRIR